MRCKAIVEYYSTEKQSKACLLLLRKWNILREIVYILSIPLRATILVQKRDLTLPDVFSIWTKMKLHVMKCTHHKSYKTNLANHLYRAIEKHQTVLFENPFMSAALFLDPRFRRVILNDPNKLSEAKSLLERVWHRITTPDTQNTPNNSTSSNTSDISFEFDEQVALDNYLQLGIQNNDPNTPRRGNSAFDIMTELEFFDPEHLHNSECLLKYWEENQKQHPELYKLAMVIYSVPPTEVQIERDFSKLNFVFLTAAVNSLKNV